MTQQDPLTNALTRTAFQHALPRELEQAQATGMPLSLCMLDLDYFKSINDAYGHLRGDEVLRELVGRLSRRLRGQDSLYRYGGDEFVVLLPGTSLVDAVSIAHRLHAIVVEEPFDGSPPLWLSISVGVAAFPADAASADLLFEEADHRLYQAKRAGRNQVVGDGGASPEGLSLTDPSRLIERDDALARVHDFLGNVASLGRGTLAITGVIGSGRTQLLSMAIQTARLRGYGIVTLECARESAPEGHDVEEAEPPNGSAVAANLDELTDAFSRLRPGTGTLGTLIAIDDLDSFPADHVDRLASVVRDSSLPSVALAYTSASVLPSIAHAEDALTEHIRLEPLSPTGVRIWLRGLLRNEPPADFLQWVYDETHGLPDQVQRLLTSLIARGTFQPLATGGWRISTRASHPMQPATSEPERHNLPNLLTEVVGRQDEVRAIRSLLQAQRLVTLVGPGGIGKTRLALQVARASLADFADGVWFVPLGSIEDPDLVVPTIAQTLGLIEVVDQPLMARLQSMLASQERLLVLDNFEQIVDAAPLVSELLQAAPKVKALVTSRERLRVYGEQLYQVPPLALPDLNRLPALEEVERTEAVELFIARTQAVRTEFRLSDENARAVAELCSRLDGLPLAIELAAARTDEFTVDELLQQLNDTPALLTGGPRDLPRRQQTLRAAFEWSVDRLPADDQQLFAQLALFSGGWTVDLASTVLQPEIQPDELLLRLHRLVEKHLIQILSQADSPRFGMLETIRAFGLDRLQRAGALSSGQERHARAFQILAETAEPEMRHGAQRVWLDRLEAEHFNIRAALRWALDYDQMEIAGRLGAAIWRFWSVRNHVSEGRRWLEELREHGDRIPVESRVHLLIGSGVMAWIQGEYDSADAYFHASLELNSGSENLSARAMALNNLGLVARQRADYGQAQQFFEASLEVWRGLGDVWGTANVLGNLGRMAQQQGHAERARTLADESITLRRDIGDRYGLAIELHTLGLSELDRGQYFRAGQLFDESLRHAGELNDPRLIAMSLTGLGRLAQAQGRWPETKQRYLDALRWWQELEHKEGVAESLEGIASALSATAEPLEAACLFGAADQLRRQVGAPVPPSEQARLASRIDATRAQLTDESWTSAWQKGSQLTMNDAIATARSASDPLD